MNKPLDDAVREGLREAMARFKRRVMRALTIDGEVLLHGAPLSRPTCDTCRWSEQIHDEPWLACHRHAPSVFEQRWPHVQAHDWCGDHELSPQPPAAQPAASKETTQ